MDLHGTLNLKVLTWCSVWIFEVCWMLFNIQHFCWIRFFAFDAPLIWAMYHEHWRSAPSKNNCVEVPGVGRQWTSVIITNLELHFKTVQNSSYYLRPYNIVLRSTLLSLLSGGVAGELAARCKGPAGQPKDCPKLPAPSPVLFHPRAACMLFKPSSLISPP